MAKTVGLARNITLEWIDAAADCQIQGKTKDEAKEYLDAMISTVISSPDNIRKTRTICLNAWYTNDPFFQEKAIEICHDVYKAQRLPLHWSLLLVYYPIFYDLCYAIGTQFTFRDEIQLAQIKARIYDTWGERATLYHSLDKNIKTLKDLNAVAPTGKPGEYIAIKHSISDPRTLHLVSAAILQSSGKEYMTWEEITGHPALFPFSIEHLTQADIAASPYLALERMGDQVVIRRK